MRRVFAVLAAVMVSGFLSSVAQAQFVPVYENVAITEFLSRPIGEQDGREWIELYNFGDTPVDLKGWQFSDDANKLCDIPAVTIAPKDFVIVIVGHDWRRPADERKKIFEAEWLGGKADPRVVAIDMGRYPLDAADMIVLKNKRKAPIWILAYRADDKPGTSTYLAIDDFRIRMYGTKEKPSINRRGLDGTVLGYEGQDAKQEDVAWKSDVSKLKDIGGYLYRLPADEGGNVEPNIGSPLKGNYAAAKK
jgi:hypothetical protein